MSVTQLDPPLPLKTPIGPGLAWLVIDYSPEFQLMWTVADDATKELWTWPNSKVRALPNETFGRIPNG